MTTVSKCNVCVFLADDKAGEVYEPTSTNLTDCYPKPNGASYICNIKDKCLYDYGKKPLGLVCGNPAHVKQHNDCHGKLEEIEDITYTNN